MEKCLCSTCGNLIAQTQLHENLMTCANCGNYFSMAARERITMLTDKNSFCELFQNIQTSANNFPDYADKLQEAKKNSEEQEAVICGTCTIFHQKCIIFVMESLFMIGSMGSVVGEKITLCFEYATEEDIPIVGVCASGGARLQEGLLSLMQMAKIMVALKKHSDSGNLFISLLTNPTLGGVAASFATNGDIILAEPNAIVGLAGRRIVEKVEGKKMSTDFQKAESVLKNGYIDCIVDRNEQRDVIGNLLLFHSVR